jgi:phage tail-like protein
MNQNRIKALLPAVFQQTVTEGEPMYAILGVMEQMHAPADAVLAHIDRYFDVRRTDDGFVPLLASWLDLDPLLLTIAHRRELPPVPLPSGMGHLREWVAVAAEMARVRGTEQGLQRILEIATGSQGYRMEERGDFHISISAPAEAKRYDFMVRCIIDAEKPAYVTYDLQYTD